MWTKRHVLFKWMSVARSSAQGSAVRLGWEARWPQGASPRPQGTVTVKHLPGLAHLNSVRRVLFLGLFAGKETAKKKVSDLPDVH